MKHSNSEPNDHQDNACSEYAAMTRRGLLKRSTLATAAMVSAPAWLPRVVMASPGAPSTPNPHDTLVNIFFRGGMDGLSTCVPYGDGELYNRRPTLAIQPPGTSNGAIDLDGFFGLAPAASFFLQPFQDGKLAFVHATGSPDPSRSHFDSQKLMELGIPNQNPTGVTTGWIAKHLLSTTGVSVLRGMAVSDILPRSMAGAPSTLPILTPSTFTIPGTPATVAARRATLSTMYSGEAAPLGPAALTTFATINLLATINFANYVPSNGAVYPATTFGTALKTTAALIKADVGVEVVEADLGGFDLHSNLGPLTGSMASLLDQISRALLAFYLDMGTALDRVTLVCMSEFGRRASENASLGLDHGHGNCMIVMGGHIAGGQVIRQWPGLALANLDNGDLAVTIDYRDILSEILQNRMGNTSLGTVFPNYTPVFHGITS